MLLLLDSAQYVTLVVIHFTPIILENSLKIYWCNMQDFLQNVVFSQNL